MSTPLSVTITNSLKYWVFPDYAKITSIIPLGKCEPNKNDISNFGLVIILNTSKIYEKLLNY